MKHWKKLLVVAAAVVMAMALAVPAFAATVTVTPPVGTPSDASNTYTIYKVFDATVDATDASKVSYTLPDGIENPPTGFTVKNGNVLYGDGTNTPTELTATDIAAIKQYVAENSIVGTTATAAGATAAAFGNLDPGYYYITTTTGTAVIIKTNNETVNVTDKNTVPSLDKKITAVEDNAGSISTDDASTSNLDEAGKTALAQVGKDVTYTATITVGKGAKGYVFHDKMGTGLSYNNDVAVAIGDTAVAETNYDKTTAAGDTITITFNDDYLKTLDEDTEITVTYTAKITSDALTVDPAKNTATLDYGDNSGTNKNTTPPSETETYNAKITVNKKDGENKPLPGAGFVIQNASGAYYVAGTNSISWYTLASGETLAQAIEANKVTENVSNAEGAVAAFTGLPNGVYTLIESTVPAGYNKADDETFTINNADSTTQTNREQEATVVNQKGGVLPSTGGMGTTILYIIGAILVIGAGVYLITKRRAAKDSNVNMTEEK